MKSVSYRKYLCLVAGLVIAGSVLLGVASSLQAKELFADNFNDGNDSGWTQLNRSWHVVDGRYYLDGCYGCNGVPLTGTRDGFSYTHVGDSTWTDYAFNFTFDTTGAPSPYNPGMGDVHQVQVFFRVQGQLPGGVGAPTQYRVNLWSAPGNTVHLFRYVNTSEVLLESVETPGVILQGTNVGKIIAVGGHIQIFVNNYLVLDFTDPDPIPFGGIGLGAIWEANAWFDNVSVRTPFPISKDDCKNGGWIHFGFKNQGQCIKFVEEQHRHGQESGHDSEYGHKP